MNAATAPLTVADLRVLPFGQRCELVDGCLVIGEGLTRETLAHLPPDGRRHEVLDGLVLVTPDPDAHERAVTTRLATLLSGGVGRRLVLADDTELVPDVLVTDGAPVLAVEVVSRCTAAFDLHTKRVRYETAGIAFWAFDPHAVRLRSWCGDEVSDVSGDEVFEAEVPFPVRVVPSALV